MHGHSDHGRLVANGPNRPAHSLAWGVYIIRTDIGLKFQNGPRFYICCYKLSLQHCGVKLDCAQLAFGSLWNIENLRN